MNDNFLPDPSFAIKNLAAVAVLSLICGTDSFANQSDKTNPVEAFGRIQGAEPQPAKRTIIFKVTDADTGRGIAGATLNNKLETDRDGRCELPVSFPTNVWVRAGGYVPRVVSFSPSDEYPAEYVFKLERGVSVGGEVRDESGKPVSDVKVIVVNRGGIDPSNREHTGIQGEDHFEKSDSLGRWTCNEIPHSFASINLKLVHPEHAHGYYTTESVPFFPATRERPQVIVMNDLKAGKAVLVIKRGLSVAGIVVDGSGKAIEGATVSQIDSMQSRPYNAVTTGSGGRFSFGNDGPGKLTLLVQAKGFAPESRTLEVAPGMAEVKFQLDKGQILRGRVIDEEGRPLAGASVTTESGLNGNLFAWYGTTDAEGCFSWDSAPARALPYRVRASGFMWSDALVLDPTKDHEIKLRKLRSIRVSGTVVDSQTRQPIESFKVLTSTNYLLDGWRNYRIATQGRTGKFTLSMQDYWPKYGIQIEADGYLPDTSQSLEIKDGDRDLQFSLVRTAGISGIILRPSGEAVTGAKVTLYAGGSRTITQTPRPAFRVRPDTETVVETDASGRFSFNPLPDPHYVVVNHETGFAAVTVDTIAKSPAIVLQPWGRVEGTLMVGRKAAASQTVTLSNWIFDSNARYRLHLTAQTDSGGRFVFTQVPPGEHRIVRVMNANPPEAGSRILQTQVTRAVVNPGETTSVTVGGLGRPVIGRVVVGGSDSPINWKQNYYTMELKLPELQAPSRDDLVAFDAWQQAFYSSEEGKNRMRSQRTYDFEIASDGAFRIEDVPAGTYVMTFKVSALPTTYDPAKPNSIYGIRQELGSVTKEIVVPEIPGGRSDAALDIGSIVLQINP